MNLLIAIDTLSPRISSEEEIEETCEKFLPTGSYDDSKIIRERIRTFRTDKCQPSFQISLNDGPYWIKAGPLGCMSTEGYKNSSIIRLDTDDDTIYNFYQFHNAGLLLLNNCGIDDTVFQDEVELGYEGLLGWKMQVFGMAGADITDAVIPSIIAMLIESKDSIRIIDLKNTKISKYGFNLIKKIFPNAEINPNFDLVDYYIFEYYLSDTCIDFERNQCITDSDIKQLKYLPITHLNLHDTAITSNAFYSISTLSNLLDLNLRGTKVTDKKIELLKILPSLHKLDLCETKITSSGIAKLSELKCLTHLLVGPLSSNEKGYYIEANSFSNFPHSHPLEFLSVSSKMLTNDTLMDLATLNNLKYIEILNSKEITDAGLMYLKKAKSLKAFMAVNTSITDNGVNEFRKENNVINITCCSYPTPVPPPKNMEENTPTNEN